MHTKVFLINNARKQFVLSKSIMTICFLAIVFLPKFVFSQYTLKVDLSNKIRPVTHVASGSLYGFTESLPADVATMVAPLKPNVFANPAVSGAGHQQPIGDALKVSERLLGTTGKVQVRLADILPGWPYRWPGQSSWLAQCTDVINRKKLPEELITTAMKYGMSLMEHGTTRTATFIQHYGSPLTI